MTTETAGHLTLPDRERTHEILTETLRGDTPLPRRVRETLVQMQWYVQHLIAYDAAHRMLTERHDEIAGEPVPGERHRSPGIHVGAHNAASAVETLWRHEVHAYARVAQAVIAALDTDPAGFHGTTGYWELRVEMPKPGLPGDDPRDLAPNPELPVRFHDHPDAVLIRWALGELAAAEDAADELQRLGEYEDPDTGVHSWCISEYQQDLANELEAEVNQWTRHLAGWADAVAVTLAQHWPTLTAAITTASH
jgi:hypothetical protein